MMAKPKLPRSEDEIPVWFIEILESGGCVQWHLRLSREVASGLEVKLNILLARQKICGFRITRVEDAIVPAFQFYERYGMDR